MKNKLILPLFLPILCLTSCNVSVIDKRLNKLPNIEFIDSIYISNNENSLISYEKEDQVQIITRLTELRKEENINVELTNKQNFNGYEDYRIGYIYIYINATRRDFDYKAIFSKKDYIYLEEVENKYIAYNSTSELYESFNTFINNLL